MIGDLSLEYCLPMLVGPNGYDATLTLVGSEVSKTCDGQWAPLRCTHTLRPGGVLLRPPTQVSAETSLVYPHFIESCTRFTLNSRMHTPLAW